MSWPCIFLVHQLRHVLTIRWQLYAQPLSSAVETSLRTCTAIEIAQLALVGFISTRVCVPCVY